MISFLSTISGVASPDGGLTRYYTIDDTQYSLSVGKEQLLACPPWDSISVANPPVAAAEALKKAKKWAEGYDIPRNKHFRFDSLNLFKAHSAWDFLVKSPKSGRDFWIWRAQYRVHNYGAMGDTVDKIECWILMDGTVIEPNVWRKLKAKGS